MDGDPIGKAGVEGRILTGNIRRQSRRRREEKNRKKRITWGEGEDQRAWYMTARSGRKFVGADAANNTEAALDFLDCESPSSLQSLRPSAGGAAYTGKRSRGLFASCPQPV